MSIKAFAHSFVNTAAAGAHKAIDSTAAAAESVKREAAAIAAAGALVTAANVTAAAFVTAAAANTASTAASTAAAAAGAVTRKVQQTRANVVYRHKAAKCQQMAEALDAEISLAKRIGVLDDMTAIVAKRDILVHTAKVYRVLAGVESE